MWKHTQKCATRNRFSAPPAVFLCDHHDKAEITMKTIWKFELTPNRIQSIPLPFGAQILTVQTKDENAPLLWVLVDPDMPNQERYLGIYTTNTAVPDDPGRYIGTFLIYEGSLEFHLFEMDGPPEGATE
jgi:hypothetical protein